MCTEQRFLKRCFVVCFLLIALISYTSQEVEAIIEVGIGAPIPTEISTASNITLIPNGVVSLGILGAGIDLWLTPGSSEYMVMPFAQLHVPLPIVHVYGGIGPTFLGTETGLNLISPTEEMNIKVGASTGFLTQGRLYGEVLVSIAPMNDEIKRAALILGARMGF